MAVKYIQEPLSRCGTLLSILFSDCNHEPVV